MSWRSRTGLSCQEGVAGVDQHQSPLGTDRVHADPLIVTARHRVVVMQRGVRRPHGVLRGRDRRRAEKSRQVALFRYSLMCPPTDAAVDFLVEFGGLDVLISGRGIGRAREPFDLDPVLCSGNVDRFIDWGREIGRSLFPIGVLGPYRQCLGIDEFSEVYLIEMQIASFGPMHDAMEALVLGRMPMRLDADPA